MSGILSFYCAPYGIFFFFFWTISLCNNRIRSELEVFAGFREESPSRKETTHTTDDGKQHREVNNKKKNIGWEKK